MALSIASEISSIENRERKRSADAQKHFEHAIECLLKDLWLGTVIHPEYEVGIHRRSNWYSETPQYRDPNLTYPQAIAAYDGMIATDLIRVTRNGFYDRDTGRSDVTKVIATDKLLQVLEGLEGNPFKEVEPDLDKECILLRDRVNDQRVLVPYDNDKATNEMRENLVTINKCFARHWPDLRITDDDYIDLQERLRLDKNKSPIDFSKRILTRIFSNGRFDHGGRFYRAWWHNVPSEYRKYITIDGKRTCEYDYSQLSPHMLYFAYNYEMGNEDAYDRVLDGEHRDIVKRAFNAMVQADGQLLQKPRKIDMDGLEMSWQDLRERILNAHKPIAHLFFTGIGNDLQFKDSCIAESVMRQFAKLNRMTLPIHDSFIMRQGFAGDLEEAMRRAFYDEFQSDIPIKHEVIIERPPLFEDDGNPITEEITNDDSEHSQWYDRNTMWLVNKGK